MATVLQYNPVDVTLVVGGYIMSGFSEDEMIEVERDEDLFTKKVGVGGEVARMKNMNRTGTVRISLMQSSVSNDALSILASLDEFAGIGTAPLLCKDTSGRSLFATPFAWVKKHPKASFKKESQSWVWVLDTASLTIFLGGNDFA